MLGILGISYGDVYNSILRIPTEFSHYDFANAPIRFLFLVSHSFTSTSLVSFAGFGRSRLFCIIFFICIGVQVCGWPLRMQSRGASCQGTVNGGGRGWIHG